MGSNANELSEDDLKSWFQTKKHYADLVMVNDMPFLIDDCMYILKGNVDLIKKKKNHIEIITTDKMKYIIKDFIFKQ